jgi:hypothetical protein
MRTTQWGTKVIKESEISKLNKLTKYNLTYA